MTWPMYLRRRVEVDGREIRLTSFEAEVALLLLLRRTVPMAEMIEWLWPEPDLEPDWAVSTILVLTSRMRSKGVPVINRRQIGFSLATDYFARPS